MSRILVVEPFRMLQQGIVVSLFPEHQVQLFDMIPEAEAIAAAELVIIDAAALRECDALSTSAIGVVQSCHLPVVWIDGEISGNLAPFTTFVRLVPPLKRDDLRAAAAECLRLSSAPPSAASEPARAAAAKTIVESKPESLTSDNDKAVIELVDVFEEIPERDVSGAEAGNKD